MRTPEDYELITYRLMERLKAQNVLHAEVIVSVGVCLWRKQDFAAIFEGLERGRQRGEKDFGISLLWIFDAIRQFGAEKAQSVLDLAIQFRDRNVVAFGIGGDERAGPPEWFTEVYARAAEHGLHLTAHAGESAGPESIWGALNLKAERIGHGLTAAQDAELMEELAERQIPIEICVTSNLRTGCCAELAQHPVRRYFDEGLMLTLNSDDPAMFRTSLVAEYALVQEAFGFSRRTPARNGAQFLRGVFPASGKENSVLEPVGRRDFAGVGARFALRYSRFAPKPGVTSDRRKANDEQSSQPIAIFHHTPPWQSSQLRRIVARL